MIPFSSHLLIATLSIVLSLYWTCKSMWGYLLSRSLSNFKKSSSKDKTAPNLLPISEFEAFTKLFASTLGLIAEVSIACYSGHPPNNFPSVCVMLFLNGSLDLLLSKKGNHYPEGSGDLAYTMYLIVELLFLFHSDSYAYSPGEFPYVIHISGCLVIVTFFDCAFNHQDVLCCLLRTFLMLLKGTWIMQILLLQCDSQLCQSLPWVLRPMDSSLLTVVHSNHIVFDFVVINVIGVLVYYEFRDKNRRAKSVNDIPSISSVI